MKRQLVGNGMFCIGVGRAMDGLTCGLMHW